MFLCVILYSSVADNKEFHSAASESDTPFLYCVLAVPNDRVI